MHDEKKTKKQLVIELVQLRQRMARFEAAESIGEVQKKAEYIPVTLAADVKAVLRTEIVEGKQADQAAHEGVGEVRTLLGAKPEPAVIEAFALERQRAQMVLRESEERYRTLYENNPSMYFTVDARGMVLSVNRFGAKKLGYSVDDLLGQSVLKVFHKDDRAKVRKQLKVCLEQPDRLHHWELRKVRSDGSVMWVEEFGRCLSGSNGDSEILVVCLDITERKQMETALRESEESYRTLFQHANDAIFVVDLESQRILKTNDRASDLLGYREEEFTELTIFDLDPPGTREYIESQVRKLFAEGTTVFEHDLMRKDRSKVAVEISARVIRYSGKQALLSVVRDITVRKQAEGTLRSIVEGTSRVTGEEFFRSLVQHVASALEVRHAFVTECTDSLKTRVRSLAFWSGDKFNENFEYDVEDTPCEEVVSGGKVRFHAEGIQALFPKDMDLVELGAESYIGIPLNDSSGDTIGHLAVLDNEPMTYNDREASILKIFAARAGAELERTRAEEALREAHDELEQRVEARTAELKQANETLKQGITERKKAEEALRWSEQRHQLAVDAGKVGVWDWSLATNEIYLDPKLKSMLGYEDHEIKNHMDDWAKHVYPQDMEACMKAAEAHLAGMTPNYEVEHRMVHKDGSLVWFIARATAFRDDKGNPYRMVGTDTDITDLKNAEDALRQSEERFSKAFHATPVAICISHLEDSRYIDVNNRFLGMFGYDRNEVIGKSALDLGIWLQPYDQREMWGQLEEKRSVRDFETQARTKQGHILEVLGSAEMIELNGKACLISMIEDVTERKKAQEAKEKLRQKSIRSAAIVEAQENERRRISRELHDGLGQILTAVRFNFEALEENLGSKTSDQARIFSDIKHQLNSAVTEGKRISYDLMPRILDDFGIVPALQLLCTQISQHGQTKVTFYSHDNTKRLRSNVEMGLYRIAQEALNNVVKHAGATEAEVQIVHHPDSVNLVIEDDGKGFPSERMDFAGEDEHGMGLVNMRERAEALNGSFTLNSRLGNGSEIIIEIPL